MKKKCLSILLAMWLAVAPLVGMLSPTVTVAGEVGEFPYSEEEIEDLYYDYTYIAKTIDANFTGTNDAAYRRYATYMSGQKKVSWLLDKSAVIIGEKTDEKYYGQLLTNMMTLFQYDVGTQAKLQGRFDNLKGIDEMALNVLDIALLAVGLDGDTEAIISAMGDLSGLLKLTVKNVKIANYYGQTVQDYTTSENFLKAIQENTDNEEMREAARELRTKNQRLFRERMKALAAGAEEVAEFSLETYYNHFSMNVLKKMAEDTGDKSLLEFVEWSEQSIKSVLKLVNLGQMTFKAMMLGGDVLFGTTNTFRRHNEMMAMNDIADALVAELKHISVPEKSTPQAMYSVIALKCEYYKMLLATHLRGEYLIYRLNTNDAGLLSHLSTWLDKTLKGSDQTVESWYTTQVSHCENYYEMIQAMLNRLGQEKFVVDSGFELHDGFIQPVERKTEVPEGYVGIYTFEDFRKIADSCPSVRQPTAWDNCRTPQNTAKYILMNDINMPVEYESAGVFYGVLDGNGFTIRHVSTPLFVSIGGAVIRNLGMEVMYTADAGTDSMSYGALAVHTDYLSYRNTITNCFVRGSVAIVADSGSIGSMVGWCNNQCSITNCYSDVYFDVSFAKNGHVGGLSGQDVIVSNCFNTGNIKVYAACQAINGSSAVVTAGGLIGYNGGIGISNCYNTGDISATTPVGCHVYVGGILGYDSGYHKNTHIVNCYNLGSIHNEWAADYNPNGNYGGTFSPGFCSGGICGRTGSNTFLQQCWNGGAISGEHFSGGLVGLCEADDLGIFKNCFNAGAVSAVVYAGGITAHAMKGAGLTMCYNRGTVGPALHTGSLAAAVKSSNRTFDNCYFLDGALFATELSAEYAGAIRLSEEEMKNSASFPAFDFVEIWKLRPDDSAPMLR